MVVLTAVAIFCVDFKINSKRTNQLVSFTKKILNSASKEKSSSKNTRNHKLSTPAWATVQKVSDGNTVQVLIDDKKYSIRLFGIDAPEKSQKHGKESTENLKRLIGNKKVYVKSISTDRYGRIIAKIYSSKKVGKLKQAIYLNLKQVEAGLAWHYKRYAKNENDLATAEKTAKKSKKGLWSQSKPLNPATYRHMKK